MGWSPVGAVSLGVVAVGPVTVSNPVPVPGAVVAGAGAVTEVSGGSGPVVGGRMAVAPVPGAAAVVAAVPAAPESSSSLATAYASAPAPAPRITIAPASSARARPPRRSLGRGGGRTALEAVGLVVPSLAPQTSQRGTGGGASSGAPPSPASPSGGRSSAPAARRRGAARRSPGPVLGGVSAPGVMIAVTCSSPSDAGTSRVPHCQQ